MTIREPSEHCARTSVFGLAAVAMGLTWAFSAFTYETIAAFEGIRDARASQVTVMYGCWLAALWLTGAAFVGLMRRREAPSTVPRFRGIHLSPALRRFAGAMGGVSIATFAVGLALIAVAGSPTFVVTPPAAWLIMLLASVLVGLMGALRLGEPAK